MSNNLDAWGTRLDAPRNILLASESFEEFGACKSGRWQKAAKDLTSPGNLCRATVSNGIEDARTSHPCERGAGLL